jgi:hypothetical protein
MMKHNSNGTMTDVVTVSTQTSQPANLLLTPVVSIEAFIENQTQIRNVVSRCLKKDHDYGVIPGTDKPTLLKPGAEKICSIFGLVDEYEIVSEEIDHDRENVYDTKWKKNQTSRGFYRYVVKCCLKKNGETVGAGLGSVSTLENKYISRPRDSENTVLKMAQKRAKIAAVLAVANLSDEFTQDAEDYASANPTPPSAPAKKGFDSNNQAHLKALEVQLTAQAIPKEYWSKIIAEMAGRSMTDLNSVIDKQNIGFSRLVETEDLEEELSKQG